MRYDLPHIIQVGKSHKPNQENKACIEGVLLNAVRYWFTKDGLKEIKCQVTAIQNRYRQEIDKTKIDRKQRRQQDERYNPLLRHVACNRTDANDTAEFVRTTHTRDDLAQRFDCAACHDKGLVNRALKRGQW